MTQILDGRIVRDKIAQDLRSKILNLKSRPKLVIIQVGNLPESNTYIRQKVLFGEKIGAIVKHKRFDADITQKILINELLTMNNEPSIHGIIVQLPISKHLDADVVIDTISPQKDVDGLTSTNLKKLWENKTSAIIPATTKGVLTLLDYYKIPIPGKKVVVIGRSSLVGKPTALAFLNRDATVTVCHSETKNLKLETKNADILVIAVGKPNLITKDHVSKNQVVIDVGINVLPPQAKLGVQVQPLLGVVPLQAKPETEPPARRLVGDVDFENVSKVVAAITPVPGGIGPMTVASLFQNLLIAYENQVSK